jgi:cytochrome P450
LDTKLNKKQTPSGPKGKLLTGHLKEFQKDPLQFLTKMAKEYDHVSQFRLGPLQKVNLITNPDMIKEILVTKQKYFVKSRDLKRLKSLVGEGLLTSEKDFHLKQRRLIQPTFKKTHIDSYGQDMIDTTYRYISKWEGGIERQISEDMMNITLGIITKTMFSMELEEGFDVIGEPIEKVMKLAIKRMRAILPLPLWIPTKANREYKKAVQALDDVLFTIINQRREDVEKHNDLLGILMRARNEEDGLGMDDEQLRDELMTIFLAGHETTANALSWTLYLLSQNPEAEVKLHEEIARVVGNKPLTPNLFNQLPYTQNIFWESMRLFPPAYVIGRQVVEDIHIGDYWFKKGEMLLISQYVMHRNPQYFENPHSFYPERFENNFLKTLPTFAYFPFGGGPRVCIGNHFAIMEAVLVLTCIAQRYRFTLAPIHHVVRPQPLITLRPKRGLRMIVEKRDNEKLNEGYPYVE